ncbi:MAG TPA: thioredoxin family protein [Streptosporangiaceae bacterium]
MGANWRAPAGLHATSARLPVEGELPSLADATGWLNSKPLAPADLRGKVAVVGFWTYTCVNWLRQLPYLRAWARRYSGQGLVVIGVHTPEFSFEHDPDNVRLAVQTMGITYPVATDNDFAVWQAFGNHYWPALYFADAKGRIRHHHFGEGEYAQSEMVIQQLLAEAGQGSGADVVSIDPSGLEVPADWSSLRSSENYTGYERTVGFASPDGLVPDKLHAYAIPARLGLNQWALSGDATVGHEATTLNQASAKIAYRFHARDLNLVMGPTEPAAPVRFRVVLDGLPPGESHGADIDADGNGSLAQQRVYQLIRQPSPVADRTFELTFADRGAELYCFTFG